MSAMPKHEQDSIAAELSKISGTSRTFEQSLAELAAFKGKYGERYPEAVRSRGIDEEHLFTFDDSTTLTALRCSLVSDYNDIDIRISLNHENHLTYQLLSNLSFFDSNYLPEHNPLSHEIYSTPQLLSNFSFFDSNDPPTAHIRATKALSHAPLLSNLSFFDSNPQNFGHPKPSFKR